MEKNKLGHQAPKNYKINKFNSIEIKGDLAYCESHDFVYDSEIEEKKLYDGEACYYTDNRFIDGHFNYYKNTILYWRRWEDISLKSCVRRTLQCKNIPVGTIIDFNKSWYTVGKKINNSFKFKIKKENKFDVDYKINSSNYFKNFTNCNFSQELTKKLRENGFIVSVEQNSNFLMNMVNTASSYTGGKIEDTTIDGEIAVAYGHGKKIGFSSFDNDYMGYSNGCDYILWDKFGNFNKWSQCEEITKGGSIDEIIEILKK